LIKSNQPLLNKSTTPQTIKLLWYLSYLPEQTQHLLWLNLPMRKGNSFLSSVWVKVKAKRLKD